MLPRGSKSSQVASKSSNKPSRPLLGREQPMKTSNITEIHRKNKENQQVGHMLLRAVWMRPKRPWELSRWLEHGLQSSQDSSKTAQGASKTPLGRLQDRPRSSQDASRTAPSAPRAPPRRSKSLQDSSGSLQDASKSSPEEVLELPSRLQELPRGASQACSCWPAASSLWSPNGLGGIREALTIQKGFLGLPRNS